MFYRYKVFNLGSGIYKLTRTQLPLKNSCYYKRFRSKKLKNNILRAKRMIKLYCECNDFKYFVTFTVNNNHNRYDIDTLSRLISRYFCDLRKFCGTDIKYIIIPEKHKNGAIHFHGLVDCGIDKALYINKNGYPSCSYFDNLGNQVWKIIDSSDKAINYCLKYITKDMASLDFGKHLYICSKNLCIIPPMIDYVGDEKDIKFDYSTDFYSVKLYYEFDAINNFVDSTFYEYYD